MANPAVVAAALSLARKKKTWVILGFVLLGLILLPLGILFFVGGLFSTLVGFLNPLSINNQGEDAHYLALQEVTAEYHPENNIDVYLIKVIDLFAHNQVMQDKREIRDFIETYFLLELEREIEVTETDEGGTEVTHTEIETYYLYKSFYEIVATVRAAPFNFGDGAIASIVNLSMSGIGEIGDPQDGNTYPGESPEPLKGRYPAPIANGVITQGYGWRINPITGREEFHPALDIQGARFSSITTIADGSVVTINTKTSPYGNYVVIKHELPEETFYTMYGHLSQIKVYIGQDVKQGETIGIEGGNPWDPNPGYSTGHHLHFEIRTENGTVNPADYIY